ncbi:MAG: GntR family transcriptional regulator [Cypionkella sp.]
MDGKATPSPRALALREQILAELQSNDQQIGHTSYTRVHQVIRNDILRGAFSPDERLKISELTGRYGISAVPIREALQQLVGEGLVVMEPNRGARVRAIDAKFVRDVHELREMLVGELTARGVARISHEIVEQMEALQETFEAALASGEYQLALGANRRFHDLIIELADNQVASQVLKSHWSMLASLRLKVGYSADRLATMVSEHRELIEACRARDQVRANEVARRHTQHSLLDMIAQMSVLDANATVATSRKAAQESGQPPRRGLV